MAVLCRNLIDQLTITKPGHGTGPGVICISGAPGSGKSTLTGLLSAILTGAGKHCQVVSLDDYYLPHRERQALALQVHPLCAVRGVPGTHDLAMLLDHLDRLIVGDVASLAMPQFDKAQDDRLPAASRCKPDSPLDYILLEGWVLGSMPQDDADLKEPVNQLEALQDSALIWRKWTRRQHHVYFRELGKRIDLNWFLRVPDWNTVVNWRWQQEQELPIAALKTREEIESFLQYFQRLVEHMQSSCELWADIVLQLDTSHCATMPEQTLAGKKQEETPSK